MRTAGGWLRLLAICCWAFAWYLAFGVGSDISRSLRAAGKSPFLSDLFAGAVVVGIGVVVWREIGSRLGLLIVWIPIYGQVVSFGSFWRIGGRWAAALTHRTEEQSPNRA